MPCNISPWLNITAIKTWLPSLAISITLYKLTASSHWNNEKSLNTTILKKMRNKIAGKVNKIGSVCIKQLVCMDFWHSIWIRDPSRTSCLMNHSKLSSVSSIFDRSKFWNVLFNFIYCIFIKNIFKGGFCQKHIVNSENNLNIL